jgi:hypothetical protein
MIVMLDSSRKEFALAPGELNCPVEQLLTPLTRYNRHTDGMFAIDNGAFTKFNRKGFESLLEREYDNRDKCRFIAVPDVVGSARRTLEVFDYWFPLLGNWPLALVAQDGQEDLPIGWEYIEAIFIGGSTKWKESNSARDIVKAAKAIGKWVHVGRINTPDRFEAFKEWGADSCDGTGLARYSHMRRAIGTQPPMFDRKEMMLEV